MTITVPIRVRPGSPRTQVGGSLGERLVVRVTARPVGGQATEAALRAVAEAFGVRRAEVRLASGPASRDKAVRIDGEPEALTRTLARLLAGPG